jgi:hypothetical protein
MYAIQARKHIAALQRASLGIIIKGAPGNEKAGEWAKLAAEEPERDQYAAPQLPYTL